MLHYLNNAGAGIISDETLKIIFNYYRHEQLVGAYQAARDFKNEIDAFYENVTKLINADSIEEIAFVLNTNAINVKKILYRAKKKLKELLIKQCEFYYNEKNQLSCEKKPEMCVSEFKGITSKYSS